MNALPVKWEDDIFHLATLSEQQQFFKGGILMRCLFCLPLLENAVSAFQKGQPSMLLAYQPPQLSWELHLPLRHHSPQHQTKPLSWMSTTNTLDTAKRAWWILLKCKRLVEFSSKFLENYDCFVTCRFRVHTGSWAATEKPNPLSPDSSVSSPSSW